MEKELVTVVYAMTKFDDLTYGQHVTVVSDHKPLAAILKKHLLKAPQHLQPMTIYIELQRYDYDLVSQHGKEMHIADWLSWAFPTTSTAILQPPPRHTVAQFAGNFMESLPYADERVEFVKTHTDEDQALKLLRATIIQGWPEKKDDVPADLLP